MRNSGFTRVTARAMRQMGVTIVEVMAATAVGAVIMAGVADQTSRYLDNIKDAKTAEHARLFAEAARSYVRANRDDLVKTVGIRPVEASANKLTAYLPAGWKAASENPYGQKPVLAVRKRSGDLEAILFFKDGKTFDKKTVDADSRQRFIAALIGVGGGVAYKTGDISGDTWSAKWSDWAGGDVRGKKAEWGDRPAVSINLFDPKDVLDSRYLCRTQEALTDDDKCNQAEIDITINRSLTVKGDVFAREDVEVGGTVSARTVSASKVVAVNVNTTHVSTTSTVKVGGDVEAKGNVEADGVLLSRTNARVGAPCAPRELGSIARKREDGPGGKLDGEILSCQLQRDPVTGVAVGGKEDATWQPMIDAQEEKSSIIGCYEENQYCKKKPEEDPRLIFHKITGVTRFVTTSPYGENEPNYDKGSGYQKFIGVRKFCALGFVARGDSGERQSPLPSQNSFCRVSVQRNPKTQRNEWEIRVHSQNRTEIACHAVCLK